MEQKKKQDAPDRESGRFKGDAAAAVYQDMDGAAHRYDDIIDLPHHVSKVHPRMPLSERAAQFSPFAALGGHGEAIRETQRQVEERMEHEYD